MTSITARTAPDPVPGSGHVRVLVYAGPDADHRAHVGALTCTQDEAAAIITRLNHQEP